jgi:transposase
MQAGIDTHKDTLAVAVLDELGRPLEVCELPNTGPGFTRLTRLLDRHHVDRIGIEGAGNYGRAVAAHLVAWSTGKATGQAAVPPAGYGRPAGPAGPAGWAGLEVVEVSPGLTFAERSKRRGAGKTDPGDAVAIARITLREQGLPLVRLAVGEPADLRALLDYREQLRAERTRLANRTHVELSSLRPGYQTKVPNLTLPCHQQTAKRLLRADHSVRADLTRRRLAKIKAIDHEIVEITDLVRIRVASSQTSLTTIYGVGPLVAGRILAEVVDIRRYRSRHAFAAANGTAPIPASSGMTVRVRLNRGGNRQLNRMLYVIAITQLRAETEGRAYYLRKRAEGKTSPEALRCLKRRLSDVVYRTMLHDLNHTNAHPHLTLVS